MDPISFGMVAIGLAGGSLYIVSLFEKYGIKVNNEAISLILELLKVGGLLYLLQHLAKLFL